MPRRPLSPMLTTPAASPAEVPGDGSRWAYEVKWDGVRALAYLSAGRVRLVSRAGNEVTGGYPELTREAGLAGAHPDAVLDGEIVVLRDGVPSFAALAERMHVRDPARALALARRTPATYIAFDVLALDGRDLTGLPWTARRALLADLGARATGWQVSPVYDDRDTLVEATREQGLEGVVAKRRDSRYHPGSRTGDWIKLAHRRVQSCVIGGWRWETGSRDRLGSLLVGVPDGAGPDGRPGLAFAGRVGSGITGSMASALRTTLAASSVPRCPFTTEVPAIDARGSLWCEPQVVVDVRYLGRNENGRLRQPVFRGLRPDLTPTDLRWED